MTDEERGKLIWRMMRDSGADKSFSPTTRAGSWGRKMMLEFFDNLADAGWRPTKEGKADGE